MAGSKSTNRNIAEDNWLLDAERFTEIALFPAGDLSQSLLKDAIIKCIVNVQRSSSNDEGSGPVTLPLSYRFLTLADLRSQQRTPVCSHLHWSTSHFEKWAQEGKLSLPEETELPRAHLILVGYLTNQGQEESNSKALPHWSLYVRDKTGVMACELLEFSPEWLGQLLLFPSWAYIPSQGTYAENGGYLEIYAVPVPVSSNNLLATPQLELEDPGEPRPITALYPKSAIQLLCDRSVSVKKLFTVVGELCRVSSILYIRDHAIFFLFLRDFTSDASFPVLVKSPQKLFWFHVLHSGSRYILTSLRVVHLKSSNRSVFIVSSSSELQLFDESRMRVQESGRFSSIGSIPAGEVPEPPSSGTSSQSSSMLDCSSLELCEEEPVSTIKLSKMLTFKGTITKVLNSPAGLYELDGCICLCMAHQLILNNGQALRPGAIVELQDVHLQQKPSEYFPHIMLCCCHRTVVRVTEFSRLCIPYHPSNPFASIYTQMLRKRNLDMPGYLWMVHAIEALLQKFCPNIMKPQDLLSYSIVPGMVERCLEPHLDLLPQSSEKHCDMAQEIIDEPHHCPLLEYQVLKSPCLISSFSEIRSMAERKSWELLPLSDVIPRCKACYMTAPELNRALAWSFHTFLASEFQTRPVLIGVLRSSSRSGYLQLQDQSGSLPCKVLRKTEGEGRQFWETSNLGHIVQVEEYQLIVERLIQSNFPSWEQLQNTDYITKKETRVYVQFFIDDAQTLDETTSLHQGKPTHANILGAKEQDGPSNGNLQVIQGSGDTHSGALVAKKARLECPDAGDITLGSDVGRNCKQQCLSRMFMVLRKESLVFRNCLISHQTSGPKTQQQGGGTSQRMAKMQQSFYALCAWVGNSHLWAHADGVQRMPDLEAAEQNWEEKTTLQKVKLLFMGKAIRWNDVLHAGGLYRLIAPQESDANIFESCSNSSILFKTQHKGLSDCPLSLRVKESWKLQYVALPSDVIQHKNVSAALASMKPRLSTVAKILSPSIADTLVSFCCQLSMRSVCETDKSPRSSAARGARHAQDVFLPWDLSIKLTVKDPSETSCSLDVYMDLSPAPYPLGLLPGATIHFENIQRVVSRAKKVYCKYLVCSSFTILVFTPVQPPRLLLSHSEAPAISSIPLVPFFKLMSKADIPPNGRATCRVTSVLSLSLRWVCALCTAIFKQGQCSQNISTCLSQNGVFQAYAKIVVEDGSSEALVHCRNQHVVDLLRLSPSLWEGLRRHILSLGDISVQLWARSAERRTEEETEDVFMHILKMLCNSINVCRPILLTFEPERRAVQPDQSDSRQMRRFTLRDQEYDTMLHPQLSLVCLGLQEVDYRVLSHMHSDRMERM
ncbi:CST complex subunit CTC1 [Ambystoma mexicanum]|uniref:CST complex subunit CTC1 n=1 Tax=Ambystoma mexicanum TaxID=8296 RepID=UPI0037E7DCBE